MTTSFHPSDDEVHPGERRTASAAREASGTSHDALLRHTAARMPTFFRVLKLLAKRLTSEYAPQVARIGEGQFRAMAVLYEDGEQHVGALAERCGVADPTMSKMLRSLESNGLVARSTDPENRRVVWVRLTPEGRALFDELSARFEIGLTHLLGGLTSDQLMDVLRTVDHFEALAGTDGPQAESVDGARPDGNSNGTSAAPGDASTPTVH